MFKKTVTKFKKALVSLLCVSLLMPNFSVMAASDTTNVDFNVKATEVNITVPMNFAVTINPNLPYDEGGFVYSDNIIVTNDTTCPITLGISNFADEANTFENDVLPSDITNWDDLSVKGTKKYFALGMLAKNSTEWMNYNLDSALYAKTIQESNENIAFGEVKPSQSVNFDLEASYGKAVKEGFTFTYQITWVSELYDGGSSDSSTPTTPDDSTETGSYTIDDASSTDLQYEFTETGVQTASVGDLIDDLLGVETAMAASIDLIPEEEVDLSKVIGTCVVTGLENKDATSIHIADYYRTEDGNYYKILGFKDGATVEDESQETTEIIVESDKLISVTFGKTIEKEIPRNAFKNCTALKTVDMSKSNIEYIGSFAFYGCTSLEEVKLSPVLSKINYDAFSGCTSLSNIDFPETLTIIESSAFSYSGLEEVVLPSSLESVGMYWVFGYCDNLVSVDMSKCINLSSLSSSGRMFTECTSLKEIMLPPNITTIPDSTFYQCTSLEEIIIPNGITRIGQHAFRECSNLKNIVVPSSVTYI